MRLSAAEAELEPVAGDTLIYYSPEHNGGQSSDVPKAVPEEAGLDGG